MSSLRQRVIRDFVNGRAASIEERSGKTATPQELKEAYEEADSRVDNYLEGWSGKG